MTAGTYDGPHNLHRTMKPTQFHSLLIIAVGPMLADAESGILLCAEQC